MASKKEVLSTSIDILFDRGSKEIYLNYIKEKYSDMAPSTLFRYAVRDLIEGMDDDAVMESDFEYVPSFMVGYVKKADDGQKYYHRANYDIMRIRFSEEMKESIKEHAEYMDMDMSHFIFSAVHRFFYLYADEMAWYRSRKNMIIFDDDCTWAKIISGEEGISEEQAQGLIDSEGLSNMATGKVSEEVIQLIKRICISRVVSVDEAMDIMCLNETEKMIYGSALSEWRR